MHRWRGRGAIHSQEKHQDILKEAYIHTLLAS